MNPTPSQPERPEPQFVLLKDGDIVQDGDECTFNHGCSWQKVTATIGMPYLGQGNDFRRRVSTRTAPEAVAGEEVCNTCVDNSGYIPIVHGLSNDGHGDIPCPDCNAPTPPVEADKDAEITAFKTNEEAIFGGAEIPSWPSEYHRLKAQADAINARKDEKLRNEGRKSVILLRCMQCLAVPQQNTNEFGGGECGGCIAKDLTTARATIAERDAEIAKLRDRLQIGPQGDDLIDQLESASKYDKAAIAERDKRIAELVKERDAAKAEFEHYAGWSKWRAGLWLISFPPSGASAEFVCERTDFDAALAHAAEGKESR